MTILHKAGEEGFSEIVKILLEHGSNIHLRDQVFLFLFVLFLFIIIFFFLCFVFSDV